MTATATAWLDAVLSLSAEELIGGLLVALAVALAVSSPHAWLHRRHHDGTTLRLVVVILVANVVSMLLAVGYLERRRTADGPFNGEVFTGAPIASSRPMWPPPAFDRDRMPSDHDG